MKNKFIKQFLLGGLIMLSATIISVVLIKSKPEAQKQTKTELLPLVETINLKKASAPVLIEAQGKIEAAQTIHLRAEASGKITYQHAEFKKGGVIKKGEVLIRIDQREYVLSLAQAKSALTRAKLELSIEEAKAKVAHNEFNRRGEEALVEEAKMLALRSPFLEKAQAEYQSAKATVDKAQLALEKTVIHSPINALVVKVSANEGDLLMGSADIATIIGIDEFWAEVSIPVAELAHLKFGNGKKEPGSLAKISQLSQTNTEITRDGFVTRLLPELGSLGHMARIIISIYDPLHKNNELSKELPLLPGALISAQITGSVLEDVFEIPRHALYENDSVFIVDEENKIDKINLNVLRRERDVVYAKADLSASDKIVSTKLAALKEGQEVRIASTASQGSK